MNGYRKGMGIVTPEKFLGKVICENTFRNSYVLKLENTDRNEEEFLQKTGILREEIERLLSEVIHKEELHGFDYENKDLKQILCLVNNKLELESVLNTLLKNWKEYTKQFLLSLTSIN